MGAILWFIQLTISIALCKYVYVEEKKDWHGARSHCLKEYTDLAPINDASDVALLRELAGDTKNFIWFGLLKNKTDASKWRWSGGGEVTMFMWADGQPNIDKNQDYGLMINYQWHDADPQYLKPFFCYSVYAVREMKTWEEAWKYCRQNHRNLASISSETEMMLIQKELSDGGSTGLVWMGLSFLSGDWLWVDGTAAGFEAWGRGSKPACPRMDLTCGALVSQGNAWEAHNCEDKLPFVCY